MIALEHGKAESDFGDSDEDRDDDEDDDDPGNNAHFRVGDGVGEDFGEIEEDSATLVQDFDARVDLKVLANGGVERVKGGLGVPEKAGNIEDIRSCAMQELAGVFSI